MVFCKCATKPVTINGVCHVCGRAPAPHEERSTINEIIRPGIGFELPQFDSEFDLQPA